MINNYSHIGFLPGNSLQSSELNEIQERFYLDQTLQSNFIHNWFIFTENYTAITGIESSSYLGPYSTNVLPMNPKMVVAYYSVTDLTVTLNVGWYKINNQSTNNMSIWCYLNESKTTSMSMNAAAGTYTVVLDFSFSEVLCSADGIEEGYAFNSNVGGYIESWIPGSNRFKASINNVFIQYSTDQIPTDLTIAKIRTGVDDVVSGRFLVQYNNNYKINDINIS